MFPFKPPRRPAPLIRPTIALSDLLADLAMRMAPEQRGAFLAKMAAMDRQQGLSPAATTLGRA